MTNKFVIKLVSKHSRSYLHTNALIMTTLKYTKRDSQTIQTVAYYKVWDNHLLNIGRYKSDVGAQWRPSYLRLDELVFPKLAGEINRTKNVKNNSKKYLRVELIIQELLKTMENLKELTEERERCTQHKLKHF